MKKNLRRGVWRGDVLEMGFKGASRVDEYGLPAKVAAAPVSGAQMLRDLSSWNRYHDALKAASLVTPKCTP